MKEKNLIKQLKRDNTEAFKDLYQLYVQRLYRFVLRTAKSPQLAEDVVHDVFVKVWEHRDKLDPEKSFQAWLFTVARNHLLNLIKRGALETAIVDEKIKQSPSGRNGTWEDILYSESNHLFHEAIRRLPEKRKQVFELCHVKGLTYQETADQLGITESTVNSQMVKARRSIQDYFEKKNRDLLK